MLIAQCLTSDADKRSLRLLSEQWKAAVDSSVTRYGLPTNYVSPFSLLRCAPPSPCYSVARPQSLCAMSPRRRSLLMH